METQTYPYTEYRVEYLDEAAGKRLYAERAEDEADGWWDVMEMDEITVYRRFPNLGMAKAWMEKHAHLDVFRTPRVSEIYHSDPWESEEVTYIEFDNGEWYSVRD